jgi:glycosyltransferase involved in cell wall biosynthesis
MPKVSVVIPFCNRIEWTKEAIQSVLSQTFQDFELLVVDDGSEIEYKKEIQELDNRIVYLRQEKKGVSAARNLGIRQSSGEFIAFLDSDDSFLPEKFATQIRAMEEHDNILLSHTSYNQVDQEQKHLQIIHSGLFAGKVYPGVLALCPIATPTVMIRRAAFETLEFRENIRIAEDLLLWSQVSKRSAIIGIDITLTNVRIHGQNAAINSETQLEGLSNIVKYGLDQDPSISNHDRNIILYEIYSHTGSLHIKQKRFIRGFINHILAFKARLSSCESFLEKVQFLWSLAHTPSYKIARIIFPKPIRKYVKDIIVSLLKQN